MAATNKTWSDGVPPTCAAADLNGFKNENNVLIQAADQVINTGDNDQTAKSVTIHSHDANYYSDSGVLNAYVLSMANTSRKSPVSYTEGMLVRFRPGATNSGASTVNVASLGAKSIVTASNSALSGGELSSQSEVMIQFSTSFDAFILVNIARNAGAGEAAQGYIYNFRTEPGTDQLHDVRFIGGGTARDALDSFTIRAESSEDITKKLDSAWAEGDSDGGRPSGVTLDADTWYRCFVISKEDGTTDYGFDTAVAFNASNLMTDASVVAAGYVYYRQVAWVLTDSSADLIGYSQSQGRFTWDNMQPDSTGNTANTARDDVKLSAPPNSVARTMFRTWAEASLSQSVYLLVAEKFQNNYQQPGGNNFTEQLFRGDLIGGSYGSTTELNVRVDNDSEVWVDADATDADAHWALRGVGFEYQR